MLRTKRVLALSLLLALVACAAEPVVDRADVERIITTLAADEMEGRGSFTPAAGRAADFIAAEFADIGLSTLAGDDDYLQGFPVYSMALESVSVRLNGVEVPADRIAASLGAESVEWGSAEEVEILMIGPDDNPMAALRGMGGSDRLVLFDEAHAQLFARVRGFLARGSRSLDPAAGGSSVMVLAPDTEIASLDVRATAARESEEIANVVGVIPGRRDREFVLFSAHYDHIGIVDPVDGDSIANGANDDASGTTAVVELARYFAALGEPERTLVFVAFIAEEMGGYGSRYFSQQLDPEQIVAMSNIEMIGKPSARGPDTAWITGFDRSDLGAILQGAVEGTEYEFFADPYPDQNLFYRSDNATLARLGVPAHSISTTQLDIDEDYHQVSDEVATLDLDHLTNTIRAIAAGARTVVSGEATPTRIDPATVN